MPQEDPTVWCLLGKKAGDNTQVLALAGALGLGYEEKHVLAHPWELLTHLSLRVTLAGIDRAASSPLVAPWPDLVITAGRRNEPVARWIKRQSGGQTRLVHVGRPWAPLDSYDLIVTTPQYFLPVQDNILHNQLPLHAPVSDESCLASDLESEHDLDQWRTRFDALPRPWVALLVGGDSGQYVLTPDKGARLGALANSLTESLGGSLLVSDSPRTPAAAGDALQQALQVPHYVYRFGSGGENPYAALLALADAFVVTGESMSMLAEAADTGRPLFVFDPGDGDQTWWRLPHAWRYKPLSYRLAMRFGPHRMRRDIGRIQSALIASGRANWLAESTAEEASGVLSKTGLRTASGLAQKASPAQQELARSAEAVRQLLTAR